eukprot:c32183_g1_i1.p1 GENE.c32183_g1_i1~~c32183_g1_i1.p1  ORF type:complete len:444 (+),score=74.25 c32183_g1_i1:86-1417(+)
MESEHTDTIPRLPKFAKGKLGRPSATERRASLAAEMLVRTGSGLLASDIDMVTAIAGIQNFGRQHSSKSVDPEEPDGPVASCPDRGLLIMILVAMIPIAGFVLVYRFQFTTEVGVLEQVADENFASVVTFFFTATCTIVGIGLEALVGLQIVRSMSVTREYVFAWRFAQLLFPLFVTIAVFCKSPFGLLILSLGLWKLGFPEIVGSMLAAVLLVDLPLINRTIYFLNSGFLFLHHICASYIICGIISGEFELSREIISVVIPLIMQHWICLIKYQSANLYTLLEVILEICFEIEVFRNAHSVSAGPRNASFVMLAAHWGLFMAGGLSMLKSTPPEHDVLSAPTVAEKEEDQVDVMSHTPRLWKRTVSRYEEKKRHSMNSLKRSQPSQNEMRRTNRDPPPPQTQVFWGAGDQEMEHRNASDMIGSQNSNDDNTNDNTISNADIE